jgi:transposase
MEDKIYLRHRAYELRKKGNTPKRIAKELKVSEKFVNKWYARGVNEEGFHDSERVGRPRAVPDDLRSKEKKLLKRKRSGSAPKVAKKLKTDYGVNVSSRTVRRDAKALGLKSRVRPKKPRLYKGDKARRLEFAQKRRPKNFWSKVWWSDEKAFVLHNEPRRQWVETMDEVEPRGKDLVEKSVRVWAAVSDQGRTEIYKIQPYWTSADYVEFLKKKAMPDIRKQSGGDFVFEQDGDGAHRGKVVEKYFIDNGINTLKGPPARSPDIPPIENEWPNIVRGLESKNIKTETGLWKAIKKEWREMGQEKDRDFSGSVKKRLQEIIAKGGAMTRH